MLFTQPAPSLDALSVLRKSLTCAVIQKKGILLAVPMVTIKLGHRCFPSFSSAGSERPAESMYLGWQGAVGSVLSAGNAPSPTLTGGRELHTQPRHEGFGAGQLASQPCFPTSCESLSKLLKSVELQSPRLLRGLMKLISYGFRGSYRESSMGTEGNGRHPTATQRQTLGGKFTSRNLLASLVPRSLLCHSAVSRGRVGWTQGEAVLWE